jgi:hypothetical protein
VPFGAIGEKQDDCEGLRIEATGTGLILRAGDYLVAIASMIRLREAVVNDLSNTGPGAPHSYPETTLTVFVDMRDAET